MLTQEQKEKFRYLFERQLLDKSQEITVLQDPRIRDEIVGLAESVLEQMAETLDLSGLKAQELQSLIEPVIWKVAESLEKSIGEKIEGVEEKIERAKEEVIKNDDENAFGLAEALGDRLDSMTYEIEEIVERKVERGTEEIKKEISDVVYHSQRMW